MPVRVNEGFVHYHLGACFVLLIPDKNAPTGRVFLDGGLCGKICIVSH